MRSRGPRSQIRAGLLLLATLIPIPASAQAPGAALSDTVTDPAGKAVPGAGISARNVATGETTQAQTDSAGFYDRLNLASGEYDVSVATPGFTTTVTRVTITTVGRQTVNLTLRGLLSLEDLGFAGAQAQGSAADQARLDKRSHMLKLHQRYGLIAAVPLAATVLTGGLAGGRDTSDRSESPCGLGLTSVGLYSISAYYAIAAPKIPGTQTRGNTRWHKALAWVHSRNALGVQDRSADAPDHTRPRFNARARGDDLAKADLTR